MTTTLDIPAGPHTLSTGWLTAALRQSGAVRDANVTSLKSSIIGEGAGFMGQLAKLSVQYDKPEDGAPKALIAKFPAAAQENREVAMFFRFYERETGFYREIADRVELRTPRCYFNAFDPSNGDFALLLEDLAPARVGDQLAGCSAEEAALAIRELAKFQATWWNSPALAKLDWMPVINADWNVQAAEENYEQAWGPFVDFASSYLSPALRDVGERFGKNIPKLMNQFGSALPPLRANGLGVHPQ